MEYIISRRYGTPAVVRGKMRPSQKKIKTKEPRLFKGRKLMDYEYNCAEPTESAVCFLLFVLKILKKASKMIKKRCIYAVVYTSFKYIL